MHTVDSLGQQGKRYTVFQEKPWFHFVALKIMCYGNTVYLVLIEIVRTCHLWYYKENSLVLEGFADVSIPFFHYWSHMACADTSKPHQFLNNSMEYKMPINSDTEDKCHRMPVSWHILLHNTIYSFKQNFIFFLVFMLSLSINIIIHILLVPWDSQTQTTLHRHVPRSILCTEYCFWWPNYCYLYLK